LINPAVPYFFCGIIIAIFFGMLFFYGRQNKKLINDSISKAVDLLKTINDRKAFFDQYESLSENFLADKVFHNAWEEFDETVIIDNENQKIITTKRPHDYFNEHSLIAPRINLRLLHAVPNYLVGLGLLFTF